MVMLSEPALKSTLAVHLLDTFASLQSAKVKTGSLHANVSSTQCLLLAPGVAIATHHHDRRGLPGRAHERLLQEGARSTRIVPRPVLVEVILVDNLAGAHGVLGVAVVPEPRSWGFRTSAPAQSAYRL